MGLKKKIPNLITSLRMFFACTAVFFASREFPAGFAISYALALITDVADGAAARRLKAESEFGRRFDIIADNFLLLCTLIGFYFMKKELVLRYSKQILLLFGYYLLIQVISFITTKRLVFMRTGLSRIAAGAFALMIFSLLFYETGIPIYAYLFAMFFSLTEKIILHIYAQKQKSRKAGSILKIRQAAPKIIFITAALALSVFSVIIQAEEKNAIVCFSGRHCIYAEIRATPEERALGLMFRESLDEDKGMLFVFETAEEYSFWMKNMKMPIDIIFLNENKEIVKIFENVPPCSGEPCELYPSPLPALYVVETKAGYSSRHSLKERDLASFNLP